MVIKYTCAENISTYSCGRRIKKNNHYWADGAKNHSVFYEWQAKPIKQKLLVCMVGSSEMNYVGSLKKKYWYG